MDPGLPGGETLATKCIIDQTLNQAISYRKFSMHVIVKGIILDAPRTSNKALAYDLAALLWGNTRAAVKQCKAAGEDKSITCIRFLRLLQLHKVVDNARCQGPRSALIRMAYLDTAPYSSQYQQFRTEGSSKGR